MTRLGASAALLSLGSATPGLAGAHLLEAGQAFAVGSPEVRANVARAVTRMADLLRIAGGAVADAYGRAAQIVAEVREMRCRRGLFAKHVHTASARISGPAARYMRWANERER